MDLGPTLYGLDLEEAKKIVENLQAPSYRASQLLAWLYRKHIASLDEAKNLPLDFRKKLAETAAVASLSFDEEKDSSNLESRKFLFRTRDGHLLESVLIVQQDRKTVCVSTQLGCKIGCVFCASGKGKFGRNLTAGEIVEQVARIEQKAGIRISNVVFMGMGEPLDNFEATMKALKILQASWGFGLGARRITVSTSGITPKIVEFVKRSEGRVRLSISLHSSQEKKRTELVPINKRYTLRELIDTLRQLHRKLKREITFEYTLIQGINDSRQEAEGVAKIAGSLSAKVNLIPYNPIREMDFKTPSEEAVEAFRDILRKRGVRVTVRQTAGRDIDAACGQLRLDRENQ
ncbi:MAG TPA: 23S rRNA (adenine(2503)-C(2))-methyltransferase RlmN [bacterium]|nr:23S rRNA (adenine(2503)-C(2))-methyltransferase RlmN [bacterium]